MRVTHLMTALATAFTLALFVATPAAAQCAGISIHFADDEVRVAGCERQAIDARTAQQFDIDNLGVGGFPAEHGRLQLPGYENTRWSHAALWVGGTREHGGNPWDNMGRGLEPFVEVRPVSGRILDVSLTPAIVGRRTCQGSPGFTCTSTFSEEVGESRSHSWSNAHTISAEYSVSYGGSFGIDAGVQAGAQTQATVTVGWSSTWGEDRTVESTKTLGAADTVTVTVGDDGRAVPYGLATQRGELTVEIVYVAEIRGHIYAKWDSTWRGEHHHMLPLERVMQDAGLPATREIRERVVYGFYSTGTLWEPTDR